MEGQEDVQLKMVDLTKPVIVYAHQIIISIPVAIILLMAIALLTCGAFFYRGYDLLTLQKAVQERNELIKVTQERLLMLRVEPQVAKLFQEKGYKMNVIQTPLPELQPKEEKP